MTDMTNFEEAVDQVILDSERLHNVVNGTAVDTIVTEDGSTIPSVRKALLDNLYFKTPALPWVSGSTTTIFNQLYAFNSSSGVQWWYAPAATASSPVVLPADPTTNPNWRLYNDGAAMALLYAPINSPVLTGNPQAPTPSPNSNSTTIATTAFVTAAINSALAASEGGAATFAALTITGLSTLSNVIINGTTTVNGPFNADNVTGRFQNLVLTKQNSLLTFVYTDASNPTFLKTQLSSYAMQTHQLNTDIIVNGTTSSDNTTMSFTGIGNNVFDYVYIRGNSQKPANEPTLTVDGITRVNNLEILGSVSGLNLSVDGTDISPSSVTTTANISVGADLTVAGISSLQRLTAVELEVTQNATIGGNFNVDGDATFVNIAATGTLSAEGLSSLNGGFTTGAVGSGQIGADLSVGGNTSITGGLTVGTEATFQETLAVAGDVDLNSGTGTTTVNNLVIQGTVTGFTIDLTGQNITVASLTADTVVVNDEATINQATIRLLGLQAETVASSTASWTPSGLSNVYNVTVDADLTIGVWPDQPNAFSAMIYLTQDAVGGHTVTLDPSYLVLNTETINTDPGSVTILQLTFNGVADGVIDTVIVRRP